MVDQVPTLADLYQAKRDVKDINTFTHSPENTFVDGDGIIKLTLTGVLAQIRFDFKDPLTFTTGATLNSNIECLRRESDGEYFRWAGVVPHVVAPGTNPLFNPLYVAVGSASLASRLLSGSAIIAGVPSSRLAQTVIQVPGIKSLPTFGVVNGQQFSVAGFYVGSTVGGGVMVLDSTRTKADHNGGTVIAPEAINAWSGNHTELSALLNWTGSGTGCYIRDEVISVKPEYFGAKFGLLNSLAINKASLAAKSLKLELVFDNLLVFESDIFLYGDTVFHSKIQPTNGAKIIIERNYAGITLTPSLPDMSSFVKGSAFASLTGLQTGATLIFTSNEVLVKRFGFTLPYYKNDAFEVVDEVAKVVEPAFDCTYTDLSKLTVTMYPAEERTTIKGLNWLDSDTINQDGTAIIVRRSNVVFEKFYAKAVINATKMRQLVYVSDCVNITFTNSGFDDLKHANDPVTNEWWGYGVNMYNTANVSFEVCRSTGCKHAITGRHDKSTRLKGGFYRSGVLGNAPIDSHWTNGFYIDGAEIYCRTYQAFTYSGSNVSMINCDLRDCSIPVAVRTDVPFSGGLVVVNNNKVHTRNSFQCALWGYVNGGADYGNFFEQRIQSPSELKIHDNTIENNTNESYLENMAFIEPFNYVNANLDNILFISIRKNKVVKGLNVWGLTNQNRPLIIQDSNQMKEINIEEIDFYYNFRTSFILNNLLSTPSLLNVTIKDCRNFSTKVSIDACSSFKINNTDIRYLSGYGTEVLAKTSSFFYELNCSKLGPVSNTSNKVKLISTEIVSGYDLVADYNGNPNINISSPKAVSVVSMASWSATGNNVERIPYLNGYADQTNWITFTGVVMSTTDFNSSTLPAGCIGIQTTDSELQVNIGSVVKKATLSFLNT